IDEKLPNFSKAAVLILGGTPITYQHYTLRPNGEVGGLPQTSLFKSRSPKTSSPNIWVVGDTIFPGQSTAAVTLGALRVVKNVERVLS
ncbi:MAG: FAD-dependent oxidoreductase, partial [Phototrophicales bacterium]